MCRKFFTIMYLLIAISMQAQIPESTERELEMITEAESIGADDEALLQFRDEFRQHKIALNTTDGEELLQLQLLSPLLVENFLKYRRVMGALYDLYELQAVPGWEPQIIRSILPYVRLNEAKPDKFSWKRMLREGSQSILWRAGGVIEKAAGYKIDSGNRYLGSPLKTFVRYRYNYQRRLQFGIAADKDAGESLFSRSINTGFDFLSVHLVIRDLKNLDIVAIGDYMISLGQGLVIWQGGAFGRGGDASYIKRQGARLRPHQSAAEFGFFRGGAIQKKFKLFDLLMFASYRKLSGNVEFDEDAGGSVVRTIYEGGLHRTPTEIKNRKRFTETAAGYDLRMKKKAWDIGLHSVLYRYSIPLKRNDDPYLLFAQRGSQWMNTGIDFSITKSNFHFFGEFALDRNLSTAFLQGLMVSLDPRADLAIVYRNIDRRYQSPGANSFTQLARPGNEHGIYTSLFIRPKYGWRIDLSADVWKHPWLRYQVNAPSVNRETQVQLAFTPSRNTEIYARFRYSSKLKNETERYTAGIRALENIEVWQFRLQFLTKLDAALRARARLEWKKIGNRVMEDGFSLYTDLIYKPLLAPYSGNIRLQVFDTDGYDSRIYAYENDVLYYYGVPALSGRGYRVYINLGWEPFRNIGFWIKAATTIYNDGNEIGSGLEILNGNHRTEWRLQMRWTRDAPEALPQALW